MKCALGNPNAMGLDKVYVTPDYPTIESVTSSTD